MTSATTLLQSRGQNSEQNSDQDSLRNNEFQTPAATTSQTWREPWKTWGLKPDRNPETWEPKPEGLHDDVLYGPWLKKLCCVQPSWVTYEYSNKQIWVMRYLHIDRGQCKSCKPGLAAGAVLIITMASPVYWVRLQNTGWPPPSDWGLHNVTNCMRDHAR